jgi:hypothetical protein
VRTPEHPVVVSSGDSRSSRRFTTTTTTHDDDSRRRRRRRRRRLFTTTGVRDARSFVDIGDDIHGDALVWKGAHGDARRATATATATRLLRGISCTLCGDVTETFESDERIELVTTVVGVFPGVGSATTGRVRWNSRVAVWVG